MLLRILIRIRINRKYYVREDEWYILIDISRISEKFRIMCSINLIKRLSFEWYKVNLSLSLKRLKRSFLK